MMKIISHEPDSESTTEQVKSWNKVTKAVQEAIDRDYERQTRRDEEPWVELPVNYWKYSCIAILLGAVVGMIAFTDPIIKALEICK